MTAALHDYGTGWQILMNIH